MVPEKPQDKQIGDSGSIYGEKREGGYGAVRMVPVQ